MLCVEASAAAKWLLVEERSDQARARYQDSLLAAEQLIAPPLLPVEVTNIVRQRMRRGPQPLPRGAALALALLDEFLTFPIELRGFPNSYQRALLLADAHQLPAVSDAHYVLLAQILGCELWTDDRHLLRALDDRLPFVKWIGDYASPRPR